MDRSEFWRWVRWLGLAFLLLSGMSRYDLRAAWGVGPVLWSGMVGTSGIVLTWSKGQGGAPASPQGLHFESWKRGRYEGGRWLAGGWSPNGRWIWVGIPCLIVLYLLAWTTAHYTWKYRNRRLAKVPVAPTP